MELIIDPKKLYPIKDGDFYKNSMLNSKKHERIVRHFVNTLREHFNRLVNPTVVRDFREGISVKFKFGELLKESIPKLEKFLHKVEGMNVWKVFDKAMEEAVKK